MLSLLYEEHKRQSQLLIDTFFHQGESDIPRCLVECLTNSLKEGEYYLATLAVNTKGWESARVLMHDINRGLKHNELHFMSMTSSLNMVCGLTLDEFGRLFKSCEKMLEDCFPKCLNTMADADDTHNYGSRRLKLFITMYRLKLANSFREMEVIFGWNHSVLDNWFNSVLDILHKRLYNFHQGFLKYKGEHWQYNELIAWRNKHSIIGTYDGFKKKIKISNDKQLLNHFPAPINLESSLGSLFGVDGTYSLRARVTPQQLLLWGDTIETDRMYSEYKKCHAYKLIVCMSHGIAPPYKKFILALTHGCARPSDAGVYHTMVPKLNAELVRGAFGLGDAAFHGARHVCTPYTSHEINEVGRFNGNARSEFNTTHSTDRMCSEHAMRALKIWGAVRGRGDAVLFKKDETVKKVFEVVWGLHNYIQEGCPVLDM